jgi:hypothetical protein
MRGEIPRLACVTLETLTPLHIGAGQGGGKPFDDELLGGRPIPPEYRPDEPGGGSAPVLKMKLSHDWRHTPQPYIPGASLRGWLRALYTGALDAAGDANPERKAEELFGSTDAAGRIAVNDLLAEEQVSFSEETLVRYIPETEAADGCIGSSLPEFKAEMVSAESRFKGDISYVRDTLDQVLQTIFAQQSTLTGWLRTGQGGPNPETTIPGSPINDTLFDRDGRTWRITWKMGRYAKSYAKALSSNRQLHQGQPHAYYLVDGEVPGWVKVSFELETGDSMPFRLNDWTEEEA